MSQQEIAIRPLLALALVLLMAMLPGCIDSPGDGVKVITLGASDSHGHVAGFSGSGPLRDGRVKPDVVAPGVDVISTAPVGQGQIKYVDTFYSKESGTSIAAPVAAGVAALLLQKDPSLTPAGVKAALTRGARKLNNTLGEDYEPYHQGAGQIDANRSSLLLGPDLCGTTPDRWEGGRWAFSPGNDAPGINVGADRQQKKIYALAPGDVDWTTKFEFFTNDPRRDLSVEARGDLAEWMTVMPLPRTMPANGQEVFSATISVPDNSESGIYNGSIVIMEAAREILSVPVTVEVPKPIAIVAGRGTVTGILKKAEWDHYYVEVPMGTKNLTARLSWPNASNLDVILLSPAGEKHTFERVSGTEEVHVSDPMSGLWLAAVHARSIFGEENYTLSVEELVLSLDPSSLNMGSVGPGETRISKIKLLNGGIPLDNLRYSSAMENKSMNSFQGSVAKGEIWEKTFYIGENVSRLSMSLNWKDKESDLSLRLYDPSEYLVGSSITSNRPEELEIYSPGSGKYKASVKGFKVPSGKPQAFDLFVTSSTMEAWPWFNVTGTSRLASGDVGSITATVQVPARVAGQENRGFLEIKDGNGSIQVPVAITLTGAAIKGISIASFNDSDGDGYINTLTLGANVEAKIPGIYKVQGAITDCSGGMIGWLSNSSRIDQSGVINLEADGRDIWKKSACGPLLIRELYLYNIQGDLIKRYNVSHIINKMPEEFQAPAAYFNGSFVNLSATKRGVISKIAVGVGIAVIKAGNYWMWASLQNEDGYEIATFERALDLPEGNNTVMVEFNPARIDALEDKERLYLRDLTLSMDDEDIDNIEEGWSSGEMTFRK